MSGPGQTPAKTCGDCGLCCKLMGVQALDKPAGRWCRRYHRREGCRPYDARPDACRVFNCLWLLTEALDAAWKPAACGFVLHSEQSGARVVVECDAARPHDWRRAPFEARLRDWTREVEVLVFAGSRGLRLGATADADRLVRRA